MYQVAQCICGTLVSLQKYPRHGKTYWRLVESYRPPGGNPKTRVLMHLGTADELLHRLQEGDWHNLRLTTRGHGAIAVLWAIAHRLQTPHLIDRHVPVRTRGLTVGTTLTLAAIHRAIAPGSKASFARWAPTTSLDRIVPGIDPASMGSQYFWDQMDRVSEDALEAIEADLTRRLIHDLNIKLDLLLFDITNFFTYLASTTPSELAQRGKNKQGRSNLRQWNLALLAARDGQIPLLSRLYPGNVNDQAAFPQSLTEVRKRLEELSLQINQITLVYDRGQGSRENQKRVDESQLGYVAALSPVHHPDVAAIPVSEYKHRVKGMPVHRLTKTIWGVERTLVLYVSPRLREGQVRGLEQHLAKRLKQLEAWKKELENPRSWPRKPEHRIEQLLRGQHVRDVLTITWDPSKTGGERLQWRVDEQARKRLEEEVFGKRVLMTNRAEWSEEAIINAYHGQAGIERCFKQLKNPYHGATRPQFHWTDQKIRVHTFVCMLDLILIRVLEREARALGHDLDGDALLDVLMGVRLARVFTMPGSQGGRPRVQWRLEEADPMALAMYEALVPEADRSAYTRREASEARSSRKSRGSRGSGTRQ